ncbi:DNA (cytosine-5)-methyltransferase CMT2-like isoform X2 [Juglans regia]|uniref:DNA (cytosine-5-)-methyltransferase n=1 Tax=Juglans regia TaxID=51240 RepID=A0A6P9E470_JUGRE|nr:DNA (cytosine-5)-methyltransferase CMT2-like isoform X2 [Juglans regia]
MRLPLKIKYKPVALSLLPENEDEPAPLQIFDPRCSGNKRLRRSPRLTPRSPPEVNAAQTIGKKAASMASKQSKPHRSWPRLSSASETRNAALKCLNARSFRRSPRLNNTPDPNPDSFPGTLRGSSRKSDSLKGRGSLENSKLSMFHENSPRRSPRFMPTQNGKAELSLDKVKIRHGSKELKDLKMLQDRKRLKVQILTMNADEGNIPSIVECSKEKCLRRSPRLSSIQSGAKSRFSKASLQKMSSRNLQSLGKGSFKAVSPRTSNLISRSSGESKAEPISLLWHEDGDKASKASKYYDAEFFGGRHLRRSPRLNSRTQNNGRDKSMDKFHIDLSNKNHLRRSPRLLASLTRADNVKLDCTLITLSSSDEQFSSIIMPSSEKSDLDGDCFRQSPITATSLFGANNGKRERTFIELPYSDEECSPKKFKSMDSSVDKWNKYKHMPFFVGDPIPDDEAQERWRWRYERKSQRSKGQHLEIIEDEEDEIVWNVQSHYAQAKLNNHIFSLGDCAYIKGDGGQKHIGRILEFFRTTDGENYFRVQWFYKVEDTVIKEEGAFHNKRRLFYSTIMNDNLIDCIISKVSVTQITPRVGRILNFILPSDFYFDMEYCVDYSTFRSLVIDNSVRSHDVSSPDGIKPVDTRATPTFSQNVPNSETYEAKLALLDLFSGCGGMSTGMCLGAKLTGVNLAMRWALDSDGSACESLKLNHPETLVRNETAADFLELLMEWEKLCGHYRLNGAGRTHPSRVMTSGADSCNGIPTGEYEVSRLVDICYGDPNKTGKRGLNFKVHWKGYSTSEDTWEPIEGLSNCQERIQDFVQNGLKSKILPLPGDVDVICGGPPCQGISGYNRYRNIDSPLSDDRNRQIVVFMDIVTFLKPKFVLMENVVDILRFDKASLGRYALSRLVHMNYQARLGTIAAGCYGLPQFRLRVFLWGAHPSEKLPQFPLPTHDVIVRYWPPPEFERNTVAYEEDQPRELEEALVLRDAISDLPAVTNFEIREEMSREKPPETDFQRYIRSTRYEMTGSALNDSLETKHSLYDHRPYALSEDDYLRVCQIPKRKGANFRDLPGVVVGADNVARRDRTEQKLLPSGKSLVPDYAFTFEQGKSRRPFARLWWDETVPTVVTSPSCHNQAALHPEQDRVLTIREYARLQGFPDYYRLCGTIKERYCQVGNAVAIPVARALGYALGLAFRKLSRDEPLMTLPPKFTQSNYIQLAKSLSRGALSS